MKCLISPGTEKRDGYFHTAFYLTDWLDGWLADRMAGRTMNILDIALFSYHFCYPVMNFWRRETINKEAQMARAFRKGMWVVWVAWFVARTAEQRAEIRHINS